MRRQVVRGPLLVPRSDKDVAFWADGVLASDERGMICFAGVFGEWRGEGEARQSDGVMMPPLIDIHTHIPQHPIRGRFLEGVAGEQKDGTLLAGLKRNVFPAEARCHLEDEARRVVDELRADTLAHGVVGGAAYMMVSARATEIALAALPKEWSVGMVLMNQNCPEDLRTDQANLERDIDRLAEKFGRRVIVTDRFAVAVDTPLRKRAAALARRHGLMTQTHLNEQAAEKKFVEERLYPHYGGYTEVYRRDGLLDQPCIVAHCVHMRSDEWDILAERRAIVAHCPTSNFNLGSGVMPLAEVMERGIPFALGTDVGASATQSMLAEMGRFVRVHGGAATWEQALYCATVAPARALGLMELGLLEVGKAMSFIEVGTSGTGGFATAGQAIAAMIPADLDHPKPTVRRVTMGGEVVFESRA